MNLLAGDSVPEVVELKNGTLMIWNRFLSPDCCDSFMAEWRDGFEWQQSRIRIAGVERPIPRLNAWYGDCTYQYSGVTFPPRPFPKSLDAIRDRVVETTGYCFNAALVNWYRDGRDSVAWHADDEVELGENPVIASLSLGVTRNFRLRHNGTRQTMNLPLTSGMLLVMAGAMQHHWQHCIPKEPAVSGERVNVTFRLIESEKQSTGGKYDDASHGGGRS